jgi:uncharacterized protein (DUF2267 family)
MYWARFCVPLVIVCQLASPSYLGAELPLLVRGTYYDQFRPAEQPDMTRSLDEFLERIQQGLKFTRPINAREAARSVFRVVSQHIDSGQAAKVRAALPEAVRSLWPNTLSTRA